MVSFGQEFGIKPFVSVLSPPMVLLNDTALGHLRPSGMSYVPYMHTACASCGNHIPICIEGSGHERVNYIDVVEKCICHASVFLIVSAVIAVVYS